MGSFLTESTESFCKVSGKVPEWGREDEELSCGELM